MHHFFRHAVDSKLTASPAYFDLLLQQFHEDKASGFLSAQISPDQQLVVLFVNGVRAVSLQIDSSGSQPLALHEAKTVWCSGEALVRTVAAPGPAVRALWQALLWDAADCQVLEALRFEDYLGECRAEKRCGLLYVCTPIADGFLTLWEGEVYNAETVFSSPRGFDDASPLARRAMEAPFEAWEAAYYPCRLESVSGQLFLLRLALMTWTNRALTHYQNLVGQNLVVNANHPFNTQARRLFLDIRAVGATVIDRQFFPSPAQMAAAYSQLLPALLDDMSQVIGDGLVRRIIEGAMSGLSLAQAQAMNDAGLGPNSDLWKR